MEVFLRYYLLFDGERDDSLTLGYVLNRFFNSKIFFFSGPAGFTRGGGRPFL